MIIDINLHCKYSSSMARKLSDSFLHKIGTYELEMNAL